MSASGKVKFVFHTLRLEKNPNGDLQGVFIGPTGSITRHIGYLPDFARGDTLTVAEFEGTMNLELTGP